MGKRLQTVAEHVTDITISTATVDIQVIRIGTKQMTLAVFRQLPTRSIFDECGNLLAPPWGWVNYDREGSATKPYVFSYEGVLYRDSVNIEIHPRLGVIAETITKPANVYDYNPKPISTGKWLISVGAYSPPWNYAGVLFDSESAARACLANILTGGATLKQAPQLFIGV